MFPRQRTKSKPLCCQDELCYVYASGTCALAAVECVTCETNVIVTRCKSVGFARAGYVFGLSQIRVSLFGVEWKTNMLPSTVGWGTHGLGRAYDDTCMLACQQGTQK